MSRLALTASLILMTAASAWAHVPYLEVRDFTEVKPFDVGDVTQSKAVYSWLQSGTDVDVFVFNISEPTRLFAQALVPVCPVYAEFRPSFAVVGPGLAAPSEPVPFDLPPNYGAIVVTNGEIGEPRETFYEPFGGKCYYDGTTFDEELTTPGEWYLVFWDPASTGGDYVGVVGYEETFSGGDIVRSLLITPLIRNDKELHTKCRRRGCCGNTRRE